MQKREFEYKDKNFQYLKMKAKHLAGINLADTKNELVYSRISKLLRSHNFKTFDEYCEYLNQRNSQVETEFVNAITTNFTSFMREFHHFDYLRLAILPEIFKRNHESKRIRIWSAGCSTGEEPYSISFAIQDFSKIYLDWDIKILATDIDSQALRTAANGLYTYDSLAGMPEYYQDKIKLFFRVNDPLAKLYEVKQKFKDLIYFKQFNLNSSLWPMNGPFDVIFCRNVLIYFDRNTQNEIIKNFLKLLNMNGFLILGHSESIPSVLQNQLKYIDKTIYRRVK